MKQCSRICHVVLLALLTAPGGVAATWSSVANAYPSAVRKACKTDYKRLCPHYDVNSAKMRECMRSNVGQISPRCYDTLEAHGYGKRR